MFGKIISYQVINNVIEFMFKSRIGQVEIVTPDIINIFSSFKHKDHFSRAIEETSVITIPFDVKSLGKAVEIKTRHLIIKVYDDFKVDFCTHNGDLICEDYRGERKPFVRRGYGSAILEEGHTITEGMTKHKIEVIKKLNNNEKFYGLGDKTGHLNKFGYEYEMWNTDDPSPHVESHKALYKSIPFFITLNDNFCYGIFFDNTYKTYFDMGKENSEYYYFGADKGNLDYYFINGTNMANVVSGYTYLTGKTPLPQLWTLGYHQSRWSYNPESRINEIANNMRENNIPCDAIHFDIDYMDKYKVFTWGKDFTNPTKTIKNLNKKGFKVVTIIDPGVKKELGYDVFDEGIENDYFATDKDGITYVNRVWPGDSVYPDFTHEETRKWWGDNHKALLDVGVSGIWNDMNEPASFNGPLPDNIRFKNEGRGGDHREIHNIYGHLMSKATYEGIRKHTGKRPFVITRACYSGSQKYSTVWTGDNQSMWEHLRMSLPMLMNLGLSGFSYAGVDVGGFSFDCSAELLSRWVQVGCFTPLFRNHSSMYSRDQEPWAYDTKTLDINRKYIKLRYKLLPYLYDLFYKGEKDGLPIIRPLVLHYSNDRNVHELNDEFLFGENILVAPIVEQGKTLRALYLPKGKWIDYWTQETIVGGKYILKEAPLDVCPIYVKRGSIIPNYPEINYVGEKEITELTLDVYVGNSSYVHYVDDGESYDYQDGKYNFYEFDMKKGNELTINISMPYKGYNKYYDTFRFLINSKNVSDVLFNDQEIYFEQHDNGIEFNVKAIEGIIKVLKY